MIVDAMGQGGLLGFIGGLNFDPDPEMGYYMIEGGITLPKLVRLSCQFTVIHTDMLGFRDEAFVAFFPRTVSYPSTLSTVEPSTNPNLLNSAAPVDTTFLPILDTTVETLVQTGEADPEIATSDSQPVPHPEEYASWEAMLNNPFGPNMSEDE